MASHVDSMPACNVKVSAHNEMSVVIGVSTFGDGGEGNGGGGGGVDLTFWVLCISYVHIMLPTISFSSRMPVPCQQSKCCGPYEICKLLRKV